MGSIRSKIENTTLTQRLLFIIIGLCFTSSILFVYNNYSFYERPIAKVIETELESTTEVTDYHDNKDTLFTQNIVAELQNSENKGQKIHLKNDYSSSGAYDQEYSPGNDLFVSISKNNESDTYLTGTITDVKRDKYILIVVWVFVLTLLIVGKRQGLFAVISLGINALLLSFALDIYVNYSDISLLWICSICVILFTISSLLLVNGINEKTYAAIVASLLGTFISLLIAYLVLWLTNENGLRYEEMDFLTRPYQVVFMAGVFVGSLGAVMDVAITMSASIFELYEKDHKISNEALKKSGLDIGKDIMGTMTNILFFAYISGSIPILILYFKNGAPLLFSLSMNLSLELARALAGGIGIVLTIPIGVFISIFFVKRRRLRE